MTCKSKVPCGCGDSPIGSPPPCNTNEPCVGTTCSEFICEECVINCAGDVVIPVEPGSAYELAITENDTLKSTLQKMMIVINNPLCLETAATNIAIKNITSTEFDISWEKTNNEKGFQLLIENPNDPKDSRNINMDINSVSYHAINLLPDTDYKISLQALDNAACEPLQFKIKTKK